MIFGQVKVGSAPPSPFTGIGKVAGGLLIKAPSTNAAAITVGFSTLTGAIDGTGNGFILLPGESVNFGSCQGAELYVNGSVATDVLTWIGF